MNYNKEQTASSFLSLSEWFTVRLLHLQQVSGYNHGTNTCGLGVDTGVTYLNLATAQLWTAPGWTSIMISYQRMIWQQQVQREHWPWGCDLFVGSIWLECDESLLKSIIFNIYGREHQVRPKVWGLKQKLEISSLAPPFPGNDVWRVISHWISSSANVQKAWTWSCRFFSSLLFICYIFQIIKI